MRWGENNIRCFLPAVQVSKWIEVFTQVDYAKDALGRLYGARPLSLEAKSYPDVLPFRKTHPEAS